eukprot:180585_1
MGNGSVAEEQWIKMSSDDEYLYLFTHYELQTESVDREPHNGQQNESTNHRFRGNSNSIYLEKEFYHIFDQNQKQIHTCTTSPGPHAAYTHHVLATTYPE